MPLLFLMVLGFIALFSGTSARSPRPNLPAMISQSGLDFLSHFAAEKSHIALQSLRSKDSFESQFLFSLIKIKVENVMMPHITKPNISLQLQDGYGISADVKIDRGYFGFNLETTLTDGTVVGEFGDLHLWFYIQVGQVTGGLPVLRLGNCQVSIGTLKIDSSSTLVDVLTDIATSDSSRKRHAYVQMCTGLRTAVETVNTELTKSSLTSVQRVNLPSSKFVNMSEYGVSVRMARRSVAKRYFLSSYFFIQLFNHEAPLDMGYENWTFETPNDFQQMLRVGISQNLVSTAVKDIWLNRLQNLEYRVTNDMIPNWFGRVARKLLCSGCQIIVTPTVREAPVINVRKMGGIQVKLELDFVINQRDGNELDLWASGHPIFEFQIIPSFDDENRVHLAVKWRRNDVNLKWSTKTWWAWAIEKIAKIVGSNVEEQAQKQVESFVGRAGQTFNLDEFLGKRGFTVPSGAGVHIANTSTTTENEMIIIDTNFVLQ